MKDNVQEIAVLLLYVAEKLQTLEGADAAEALAHVDAAAEHVAALIAEPPARRRGRRLQRISKRKQQTEAPKTAVPARMSEPVQLAAPVDGKDQYDKLLAECKKRGYDPDMMLGLAKALPKIDFVKPPGKDYPNPVWHGPKSRRKPSQEPVL